MDINERKKSFQALVVEAQEKTGLVLVAKLEEKHMGEGIIINPVLQVIPDPTWTPPSLKGEEGK